MAIPLREECLSSQLLRGQTQDESLHVRLGPGLATSLFGSDGCVMSWMQSSFLNATPERSMTHGYC